MIVFLTNFRIIVEESSLLSIKAYLFLIRKSIVFLPNLKELTFFFTGADLSMLWRFYSMLIQSRRLEGIRQFLIFRYQNIFDWFAFGLEFLSISFHVLRGNTILWHNAVLESIVILLLNILSITIHYKKFINSYKKNLAKLFIEGEFK